MPGLLMGSSQIRLPDGLSRIPRWNAEAEKGDESNFCESSRPR